MSDHEEENPSDGISDEQPMWGYIHRRRTDKVPTNNSEDRNNYKSADNETAHDNKNSKDDEEQGHKDKPMSPHKKRWLIIIAIIVAALLIVAGVLYYLHARHYEDTDDAFVDGHVSQVSPRVNGQIQTLYVTDNQAVEAGQLLVEIDPHDYQIRLEQAQAQLTQALAQVSLQKANIGQAQANIDVAEAQTFQANRDQTRFTTIDVKAITREQRDSAIANAKSANARLEAAREQFKAAEAQEEVAQASVSQAQADVSNAELQLSYTKIVSPIAGKVTRRTVEVGNVVTAGMPLLAIASNDLWITANFKETQLDYMQVGQKVRIEIDAFPDVNFSGHIDSFQKGTGAVFSTLPAENATGNYVKVVQRVPVKIVFDDPHQRDHYPIAFGLSVIPRVTVR